MTNPEDLRMDNTTTIKITGMTCHHCKANVEKNLKNIPGIDSVLVDLENQTAKIQGDSINLERIRQTVEELGYGFES